MIKNAVFASNVSELIPRIGKFIENAIAMGSLKLQYVTNMKCISCVKIIKNKITRRHR